MSEWQSQTDIGKRGREDDKVAVVTGGASGIGRAVALRLASEGYAIAVWDIDETGGEETIDELVASGGSGIAVRADVGSLADVEAAAAKTTSSIGAPQVLVNNAAVRDVVPLLSTTPEDWKRVIAVNLDGVFYCTQVIGRLMVEHQQGAIVNISSVAGMSGFLKRAAYVASKHGVIGLTRVAAMELASAGVRVNAVAPGFTLTPLTAQYESDPGMMGFIESSTPLARWGRPEEIADAVVYLTSERASFITGITLPVDGGYMAGKMTPPEGVKAE